MFIPPPHHHLLKRILFPIGCSWLHYQILVDSVCRNLILGSVLLVSVHFYATTIPFKIIYYYCSFVVQSKTGHDTSGFVIFSEKCFDYLQTLSLHINFEIFFSISVKNTIGILMEIVLNLPLTLSSIDIITISILMVN